jgi:CO/xanthine dehydrogenase FAD-binding subunit
MRGIDEADDVIRIGALATISEILEDPVIGKHVPVLADACDKFASDQVRNAATIGGNLCNASPAGDTIVPLLVLDARLELASKPDGTLTSRTVPLAEFFTAPGRTVAEAAELLVAVEVPLPPSGAIGRFFKLGTRPALDVSAVSVGIAGVRTAAGLRDARVAFGSVAPTPIRAAGVEAALEGKALDRETVETAARVARDEIAPISDVRGSAWYRREMIANAVRRILTDVA